MLRKKRNVNVKSLTGVNLALMEQSSHIVALLNIPLTFQFAGKDTRTPRVKLAEREDCFVYSFSVRRYPT